jgi:hypothetical protein
MPSSMKQMPVEINKRLVPSLLFLRSYRAALPLTLVMDSDVGVAGGAGVVDRLGAALRLWFI